MDLNAEFAKLAYTAPKAEMSGACADRQHSSCRMNHIEPDFCLCTDDHHYLGPLVDPPRGFKPESYQDLSGACADGDHGTCMMAHVSFDGDLCLCPSPMHGRTAAKSAKRYRAEWDNEKVQREGPLHDVHSPSVRDDSIEIEADSVEEAKAKLKSEHNLNPYYYKVTEVQVEGQETLFAKRVNAAFQRLAVGTSTLRHEIDISGGGPSTVARAIVPNILAIPPGESHEFVINGGEVFTVWYDEEGALGDMGQPTDDKTGEYVAQTGPLVSGKVIIRQHVSPFGGKDGNSSAKPYAAERVAEAIANRALSRTSAKEALSVPSTYQIISAGEEIWGRDVHDTIDWLTYHWGGSRAYALPGNKVAIVPRHEYEAFEAEHPDAELAMYSNDPRTSAKTAVKITKSFIKDWLFSHYLAKNPRTEAEVDCILSNKDNWQHLEAMGERYRSQRWGEDDELETDDMGVDHALGFAITGLVESDHEGPHKEGCPAGTTASKAGFRKGAPFAGYEDFDACVSANSDKDDPKAYCGKIKHQVEDGRKSSARIKLSAADQAAFQREMEKLAEDRLDYLNNLDNWTCELCGHGGGPGDDVFLSGFTGQIICDRRDRCEARQRKSASKVAQNPYSPQGNPYVTPPSTPGTPDDVMDGPQNPWPVTLDMPMTTRPRQMPNMGPDDEDEGEVDQPPGTVASRPKAQLPEGARTAVTDEQYEAILQRASAAGWAALPPEEFFPAGFAWVSIAGNTAFARYVRKTRFNVPRSQNEAEGGSWDTGYPKGYQFWVWAGNQGLNQKEAFAKAFARSLVEDGIDARAQSRWD